MWKVLRDTRYCGSVPHHVQSVVLCVLQYERGNNVQEKRYERERQAAWDRRNLRTVSTHLKVEETERLKFYCIRRGISKYFLIQQLLREAMAAEEA